MERRKLCTSDTGFGKLHLSMREAKKLIYESLLKITNNMHRGKQRC